MLKGHRVPRVINLKSLRPKHIIVKFQKIGCEAKILQGSKKGEKKNPKSRLHTKYLESENDLTAVLEVKKNSAVKPLKC